ncbi:LDH2 family malate/lactate/ureidoglycolate dehydrogenase [Hoeflea marina]|uniref:LDH2 family malate/lactate/ureidoglycolate dehydrogenase n=1 Tax=Hoeflea marina TaxID=274592 RepID=A0A317PD44_9HYPH|nr:Ldh family oxidoreductase [Hoeflea marina]PWV97102.1 LDH2 family malate/lactate/ureidoglycolate dehydrogenase [Hoeflea marina]
MAVIDVSTLEKLAKRALERAGVPPDHADTQLELLVEADLRGVPSHGLLRLERIVRRIGNGVTDPRASGRQDWRGAAFLAVDGETGLGPVVANAALETLMARAEDSGTAVAAITNSNHIGMLGWYAERVAARGFTVIALSTSEALVHPWGARRAMIGTNPVAIGIPTGGEPFMMDTATSVVSMGEIHDHAHRKAAIPTHWALDADGNPTTDAEAAKSGAIAPFGGAKGYALGLAFELMVSSLTGAAIGRQVHGTLDDTEICNKGDVFIVIKGPRRDLQAYLSEIRAMEPAAGFGGVMIPGERGRTCRAERLRDGVPLADEVWETVQRLAGVKAAA